MKSILVVGFNVRPLARSAKKAGYRVLAVDFWGDLDLSQWADQYVSVLNQQPQQRPERPSIPTAENLVIGAQELLERHGSVNHIIVSGGFDDHPDAWDNLSKLGNLRGNTSKILAKARNRITTTQLARQVGASTPLSFEAGSQKHFESAMNRLELPILVKPKHGSGGFHSRLLRSEEDIEYYVHRHRFSETEPVLVQELVVGTDASVSILGTGQSAITVSINEQLIGLSKLGKGRTKAYCGNIVPFHAKPKELAQLAKISQEMSCSLGLIGSNGFDYVVDSKGTIYFMEINPRIQATIEAIELVSNINVVDLHLLACKGKLPKKITKPKAFCARIIVYAKRKSVVPNFANIPGVVDLPMPGSIVERGDPVCTVNHLGSTRAYAAKGAWKIVDIIYSRLSH